MSLVIKYLFFAHCQDLFLMPVLLGMNMMGIYRKDVETNPKDDGEAG